MPKPSIIFSLLRKQHTMSSRTFNLRITVPQNQPFDVSFLAVAASNAGYTLTNQKVYASDRTGDSLVYLYFEKRETSSVQQHQIKGL